MKLTNKEIVALYRTIEELQVSGSPKFTYAMARTRKFLQDQVEALRDAEQSYVKSSERAQAYQKAVENLVKNYSTDSSGKPIVRGNGQVMQRMVPAERMQDFVAARELLDNEYIDVIVGADAHARAMDALMREEVDVKLHRVKLSEFPAEIPQTAMNHLYVVVLDEEDAQTPLEK